MSVAQTKAARRRMRLRYKRGRKVNSIAESIERERKLAAKQARSKGAKK